MLDQEQSFITDQLNGVDHQYLPEITALFVEGLVNEPQDKQIYAVWPNLLSSGRILRTGKVRKPPAVREIAPFAPHANDTIIPIGESESSGKKTALYDKLRIFICGISNCYNNIVMGIWGNISLIHMNKNAPESIRKGLRRIEWLIQHGSILIHLVFGYLAESRAEVKQIRLNQLLQQINEASLSKEGMLDLKTIKSCMPMPWDSTLGNPARLSHSIVRVIERLFHWIEKEYRRVLTQTATDDAIRVRLMKIDTLIKRGFALMEQLKLYTGDKPMVMRRMRMKSLIKQTLNQFELGKHGIDLKTDLSTPLPDIFADRSQLSNALKHLIVNAIDAMPKGGRLNVAAHLLSKERSRERIFTQSGIDYLVVSISDSGEGMPFQVQSRIFDPFYVGDRKSNRLGLGLAVASGIVKAHDGYIQVSSRQDRGTTFRICLPCPFKNRCAGDVDLSGSARAGRHRVHAVSYAA
jgi:signal transduction histidine kinase